MYTHNLEPVLFNIYFLEIRWYSLAYIVGITLGWWYAKKVCSFLNKSKSVPIKGEEFDNLISYLIAGIIVGGRMGYVIFYNPGFYLFNVGINKGYSINEIANLISQSFNYETVYEYDTTKPDGVDRKTVNGDYGKKLLKWSPEVSIEEGISITTKWYINNYG